MGDLSERFDWAPFTVDLFTIRDAVCYSYGITVDELAGRSRLSGLVRARQVFCWLGRELTACSYPMIGRRVDRAHTTVMHAVAHIDRVRVTDPGLQHQLDVIVQGLRGQPRLFAVPDKETKEVS